MIHLAAGGIPLYNPIKPEIFLALLFLKLVTCSFDLLSFSFCFNSFHHCLLHPYEPPTLMVVSHSHSHPLLSFPRTGISDSELPKSSWFPIVSVFPSNNSIDSIPNGSMTVRNSEEVTILSDLRACFACVPYSHQPVGCYCYLSSSCSVLNAAFLSTLKSADPLTSDKSVLAYKPVVKKLRVVAAPLKEEYHVIQRLPDDLLAGLIPLP